MYILFLVWCIFKTFSAMAAIVVISEFVTSIPIKIVVCVVTIIGVAVDMAVPSSNFYDKH